MSVATVDARESQPVWHGVTAEEACATLGVDPLTGLDPAEVERRRAEHGPNRLAEAEKEPAWHAFLRQYRDLMQLVLLGAAAVSIIALQEFSTGLAIVGITVLNAILGSPDPSGRGQFNLGSYSNKRVDELAKLVQSETDEAKRNAMIHEAFKIHQDEVGHLPLHQQALAWGTRKNVSLVQLPDNFNPYKWVVLGGD